MPQCTSYPEAVQLEAPSLEPESQTKFEQLSTLRASQKSLSAAGRCFKNAYL
jgi:hypothetical protein